MEDAPALQPQRHFLPWDRPLLPQAVEWLSGGWTGGAPLDLADRLVLVPTRQAGRRLREALAVHASRRDQAVFPPRVMLPEALIEAAPRTEVPVASRLEAILAWCEVVRRVDLDAFRAVFPVDPPERSLSWARGLASGFQRLQRQLGESGLSMGDVPGRVSPDFPEQERWRQLGQLEKLQRETLAARGLRDSQAAWLEAAKEPALPPGVARIVLLGLPDPIPLAVEAVARLGAVCPIDVVVHAPEGERDVFDSWGRPVADAWSGRRRDLAHFVSRVHLCPDPSAQAERMADAVKAYRDRRDVAAIGSADPEVVSPLAAALARAGMDAYDPEGTPRARGSLYQLLSALARLADEGTFASVSALARCPDFLSHLSSRLGAGFSPSGFLATLDDLHERRLPATLADARRHRPSDAALRVIADTRARLVGNPFVRAAVEVPAGIFAARRVALGEEDGAAVADEASAWMEIVRACAAAMGRFGAADLAPGDWWEIALGLYAEGLRYEEKAADAIELQGWLELLWEDAPHLLVAGMNDGKAPEAVAGDPFLPESLRVRLGLKTNAQRFARDAYILTAIDACRKEGGRLDLLLGRTSAAGDPLRPSRLLLQCPDDGLPERVEWLFRPVEAAGAAPSWRRAWKLRPRRADPPVKVAVTAMRAWLECPFRFYLRHVLGMETVDDQKNELDALDFGTLCHAALEAMGREDGLRDCTDERVLRDFLLQRLEAEVGRRFGPHLTLPLVVQVESARQRLSRAASIQASTRSEGWVIERVEEKFELKIGGLGVSGKIDRIERNEATGEYRVIDYKTSDRAVSPEQAHLRRTKKGEEPAAFVLAGAVEERLAWKDLQLPLYLRALTSLGAPVSCAYFNLPKAAGETAILAWGGYTRELDASAWRCAEGVAEAIVSGKFWPPNEDIRADWDDFGPLFHDGVAASVAWEEDA